MYKFKSKQISFSDFGQPVVLLLSLKVQNLMGYPVHILLEKMAS